MSPGYLKREEVEYIRLLLLSEDVEHKKSGLQRLCSFLRHGYTLRYPHPFRVILNGLLHHDSSKVRRWALNAIALAGNEPENLQSVLDALDHYRSDPDVVVSGIAALFAICKKSEVAKLLRKLHLPLEGSLLIAAAQYSKQHLETLARKRVNIDRAEPLALRMAALLVGMDKAPEHLFTLNHPNRAIVGQLNLHDDSLVSQYSIWAITENPTLGVNDLCLRLGDFQSRRPNVRSWLYRLISSDSYTAAEHREMIEVASRDDSTEAREGMAIGLRNVYFDGLEGITYPWLPDEKEQSIRDKILEHMAANVSHCTTYREPVIDTYQQAAPVLRARIEAAAVGTPFYAELKKLDITRMQLEFNLNPKQEVNFSVVNQHIDNRGGTIGALVGKGNITAETVNAVANIQGNSELKATLTELLRFIQESILLADEQRTGNRLVKEAAENPTKGTLSKIVRWLGSLKEGTSYVTGTAADITAMLGVLDQVGKMLGS